MEKSTAETVVRVYAILAWIGALFALIGALALLSGGSIFRVATTQGGAAGAISGLSIFFGIFLIAMAVFDAIVGWGLWTLRPWARIAAIVMSAIDLLSFPVGTIIGVIGIWLFAFEPTVRGLFGARDARATATPVSAKRP